MSVTLRSQKQPLGRAADQTIMIPSKKTSPSQYYYKNSTAKNPPTQKNPKTTNSVPITQCPQAVRKFLWQMTALMFFDLLPSLLTAL